MTHTGGLRYWTCPDCGEMHDRHEWPDNHRRPSEALAAPMVIRDDMPVIRGQHDGKLYDSKRAIRASYQPSGNAEGKYFTEIGNDPARHKPFVKPKPSKKGIRDSLRKAEARFKRGERSSDAMKFK